MTFVTLGKADTLEDLERLSTSERLRMWADVGSSVRSYGPIEDDLATFGERWLRKGLIRLGPSETEDTIREHLYTLHFSGRWAQAGFNVFDLSPDLAASFLLTTPTPIEGEIKLPFACFYIRLPPGIVPMFIHGRQVWAEGIWVNRFTSRHRTDGEQTPFFRWTIEYKTTSVWKDRRPTNLTEQDDSLFYGEDSVFNLPEDPPIVPEDDITLDRALRVIKNLVSWLDATNGLDGPKPEPPHLKKKASDERKKQIESGNWPHVWIFGKNVKLRPELRRAAHEFALSLSPHAVEGWKLRARLVVRGHFKWQAHGEGRLDRKHIWIEPYWRGPDGAAAWAHLYDASV